MIELMKIIEQYSDIDLIQIVISGPKGQSEVSKVKVRPVMIKQQLKFQCVETVGAKELHKNCSKEELTEYVSALMNGQFKQLQLEHVSVTATALVSKKGKVTIKTKHTGNTAEGERCLAHNRSKNYILEPDKKVDFLVELGVMSQSGKVIAAKYDKFRQINRFLEFIQDILPSLNQDRELTIVDFGCGKSYLTFAMYYYLREIKGYDVNIIGLDLKADVIEHCNQLSQKFGYQKLNFYVGDIASYEGCETVDMVVTLHACDTATDHALAKAVAWNADVILSVPCCQHELNGQISNEMLAPILSYGIIKERMAALTTDALRGQLLECVGYETQILEFVDMEHTPKNLLIRAVKKDQSRVDYQQLQKCMEELQVQPTLATLLREQEKL